MAKEYSQATQDLIDRIIRCEKREDFILDKPKAEECILKTYDLFNLKRPSKVVWLADIFDKEYQEKSKLRWLSKPTWLMESAWPADSIWLMESTRLVSSVRLMESTRSAESARSAWSAESTRSAWLAWLEWSSDSMWLAESALDYDFGCYISKFEYCQNPHKDRPPNSNDIKYLEYSELLLQAKEYGMGYRVEYKDTLYCVPTPLVLLDNQKRFHSLEKPAIRWKGGSEFYFIHGVNFPKDLWEKIINKELISIEIKK
jgi:hypothetical protein